jgi:hypothetical protein
MKSGDTTLLEAVLEDPRATAAFRQPMEDHYKSWDLEDVMQDMDEDERQDYEDDVYVNFHNPPNTTALIYALDLVNELINFLGISLENVLRVLQFLAAKAQAQGPAINTHIDGRDAVTAAAETGVPEVLQLILNVPGAMVRPSLARKAERGEFSAAIAELLLAQPHPRRLANVPLVPEPAHLREEKELMNLTSQDEIQPGTEYYIAPNATGMNRIIGTKESVNMIINSGMMGSSEDEIFHPVLNKRVPIAVVKRTVRSGGRRVAKAKNLKTRRRRGRASTRRRTRASARK